jgi:sugar (glycoside-pentoside-hexuronide) transporter
MSKSTNTIEQKVPTKMKIGYGIGNWGICMVFTTISYYYMYFLTDIAGIGVAMAGTILMIGRFYDAVTDPVMGVISDHTRTRWGQKRPYILLGSFPMAVSFILALYSPDFSQTGKIVYYILTGLLMWTFFTVVTVPHNSMQANLTLDSKERSSISAYFNFFAVIASITIGAATKPFLSLFQSEKTGFLYVGILFGIIAVITLTITFFTTKERFVTTKEYSLKELLPFILQNKPFLICVAIQFIGYFSAANFAMLIIYFAKYNMQQEAMIPIALTSIGVAQAASFPLWVMVAKKIGKKSTYVIGNSMVLVAALVGFFIFSNDIYYFIPSFILVGAGGAAGALAVWSMIADTVEYGQWKTGKQVGGAQYGMVLFFCKLAGSMSAFILGITLEWSGFIANTAQSEKTLWTIRILLFILPIFLILVSMLLVKINPINEAMHKKICEEIEVNCADKA